MALKPLPRLIIIVAVVSGIAFSAHKMGVFAKVEGQPSIEEAPKPDVVPQQAEAPPTPVQEAPVKADPNVTSGSAGMANILKNSTKK